MHSNRFCNTLGMFDYKMQMEECLTIMSNTHRRYFMEILVLLPNNIFCTTYALHALSTKIFVDDHCSLNTLFVFFFCSVRKRMVIDVMVVINSVLNRYLWLCVNWNDSFPQCLISKNCSFRQCYIHMINMRGKKIQPKFIQVIDEGCTDIDTVWCWRWQYWSQQT